MCQWSTYLPHTYSRTIVPVDPFLQPSPSWTAGWEHPSHGFTMCQPIKGWVLDLSCLLFIIFLLLYITESRLMMKNVLFLPSSPSCRRIFLVKFFCLFPPPRQDVKLNYFCQLSVLLTVLLLSSTHILIYIYIYICLACMWWVFYASFHFT